MLKKNKQNCELYTCLQRLTSNYLFIFGTVLISLAACKNKKQASSDNAPAEEFSSKQTPFPASEKAIMPLKKGPKLIERHWKAIEIMGRAVEPKDDLTQVPYITFSKNGEIIAHGGCNAIYGKYELGVKNFIVTDNLAQTKMLCETNNYDGELIEALTLAKQYVLVEKDKLQLIVGKRAPLGVFMALQSNE